MDQITLRDLLTAVGGTLLTSNSLDTPIAAVDTDSRKIRSGSLFIPLEGEKFDGHAFLRSALTEGGAVGCLTARTPKEYIPGRFYVKVSSTLRALGDLSRWYRGRFDIPFIAVTGSVGKTTTKDMVAAVLGEKFNVLKTDGNFNNNIGLPLTLLRLDHTHEICVLEMGMNHAGEIAYLSGIAEPDIALITNIGDSHIENLGSRENIFKAKCEIFSHMRPNGLAILNGDDAWLLRLQGTLPFETRFVGVGEGLDYRASNVCGSGDAHMSCILSTPRTTFRADIPALGAHMVYPSLMASAVGERFGMTADEIVRGIGNFLPTKMRMNVQRLAGDVVVLNDAYNANPQSMRAAAAVLGCAEGRRKVAVVGDMLELGDENGMFHRAVGRDFAEQGIDRLIAVGRLAKFIAEGAVSAGMEGVSWYADVSQALPVVRRERQPGSTILVKASRAMRFERFVEELSL